MLQLRIAAIGREKGSAFSQLTDEYLIRARDISRALGFSGPDLAANDAPRQLSGAERQAREAALLADAALPGGEAVVLDERGREMSSRDFATFLARRRDAGSPAMTFFLGGADGHAATLSEALGQRSVTQLSLGKATWPHLLARVMLAEQIYRALTILAGHPYHRD